MSCSKNVTVELSVHHAATVRDALFRSTKQDSYEFPSQRTVAIREAIVKLDEVIEEAIGGSDDQGTAEESENYKFGGFTVTSTNLLILISELEGSYQQLKYLGFKDDMETLEEIKGRYYKLYFKTSKEEKLKNETTNT